jgi:hypothetical protein
MEQDQNKVKICRISYCVRQILDYQAKTFVSNIGTYVILFKQPLKYLVS